jgi:NACalpha-BTF3-like transcription factor
VRVVSVQIYNLPFPSASGCCNVIVTLIFFFSSRECQLNDWPEHKLVCNQDNQQTNNSSTELKDGNKDICSCGTGKPVYNTYVDFETAAHNLAERTADKIMEQRNCERSNITERQETGTDTPGATGGVPPGATGGVPPGATGGLQVTYFEDDKCKSDVPKFDASLPKVTITLKCNKEKYKLELNSDWSGDELVKFIAGSVSVPLDKFKLIHKGKMVDQTNVREFLKDKAIFQAFGEKAESESGLDSRDIDVLMKQLCVDRNSAIKALRKSGDLLDAMLELGSK